MSAPTRPLREPAAGAGQPSPDAGAILPHDPADPAGPRCSGTGTYTAHIPLADAIVLDLRPCPGCHDCTGPAAPEPAAPRRRLLLDTGTGRIGEEMGRTQAGTRVWLRPVGGGKEWPVDVGRVEDVTDTAT